MVEPLLDLLLQSERLSLGGCMQHPYKNRHNMPQVGFRCVLFKLISSAVNPKTNQSAPERTGFADVYFIPVWSFWLETFRCGKVLKQWSRRLQVQSSFLVSTSIYEHIIEGYSRCEYNSTFICSHQTHTHTKCLCVCLHLGPRIYSIHLSSKCCKHLSDLLDKKMSPTCIWTLW